MAKTSLALAALGLLFVSVALIGRCNASFMGLRGHKASARRRQLLAGTVIGEVPVTLDNSTLLSSESLLGSFTCDAILYSLIGKMNVSSCLVNGGGMAASLPKGKVYNTSLALSWPYNNKIVVLNVTGAQLLAALENGVSAFPKTNLSDPSQPGKFPQVGGLLRYVFNGSRPVGQRLVSAFSGHYIVDAKGVPGVSLGPIDPCSIYTLATIDYLANGGDGYSVFKNATGRVDLNSTLQGVIADRLAWTIGTPPSPITTALDDRIISCSLEKSDFCVPFTPKKTCDAKTPSPTAKTSPSPMHMHTPSPMPMPMPKPSTVPSPVRAPRRPS